MIWYSHFFKYFPQFVVFHTVQCFNLFSEAKVDVFLEFLCFYDDPADIGNFISSSSAFFKIQFEYLDVLVLCTIDA